MTDHPHRLVTLAGASNFRDLGGYPGHAGRTVRWRRLYRSDHLGLLTEADQVELRQRGVATALDFRGLHESAATHYSVPGLQRHALHIEPTVVQRMHEMASRGQLLDEAATVGLMEDLYRAVVRQQSARLAQFFAHVLAAEQPLVFHCTAGKDRTGVAAALLLSALGVQPDLVMQDFLLTNRVFRPPTLVADELPPDARRALWSVRAQYLQAALQVIESEHGGLVPYLRDVLGLSPTMLDDLAQQYLEPV